MGFGVWLFWTWHPLQKSRITKGIRKTDGMDPTPPTSRVVPHWSLIISYLTNKELNVVELKPCHSALRYAVGCHCDCALIWGEIQGGGRLLWCLAFASHSHLVCFTLGTPLIPEMVPSLWGAFLWIVYRLPRWASAPLAILKWPNCELWFGFIVSLKICLWWPDCGQLNLMVANKYKMQIIIIMSVSVLHDFNLTFFFDVLLSACSVLLGILTSCANFWGVGVRMNIRSFLL